MTIRRKVIPLWEHGNEGNSPAHGRRRHRTGSGADALSRYDPLDRNGYAHEITFLKGKKESASELMPRVHRIASLLKRWILGTHQGAVSHEHLEYYLDEFTFRFNRRRSSNRGKLFYRLAQQAVAIDPVPYKSMVKCADRAASQTTTRRG